MITILKQTLGLSSRMRFIWHKCLCWWKCTPVIHIKDINCKIVTVWSTISDTTIWIGLSFGCVTWITETLWHVFSTFEAAKTKFGKQILKPFIMSYDVKGSKISVVLMCLNRYYIFSHTLKCTIHRLWQGFPWGRGGGHTLFACIWTHENYSSLSNLIGLNWDSSSFLKFN